jgi:hypothetical protein
MLGSMNGLHAGLSGRKAEKEIYDMATNLFL